MEPLIIVGAGGLSRETAQAIRAINDVAPTWDLLGYVDDDVSLHGTEIGGVPVIGEIDSVVARDEVRVVVGIGPPAPRKSVVERLGVADERYATIVHPGAWLAHSTSLGVGCTVLAGVVTTCDVSLGAHAAVMPQVVFTHDNNAGDYATFAASATLAGRVSIGDGAYLGSGALVKEDRSVGEWSLIGMGSVVTKDVPPDEVWAGVPARFMRAHDARRPRSLDARVAGGAL